MLTSVVLLGRNCSKLVQYDNISTCELMQFCKLITCPLPHFPFYALLVSANHNKLHDYTLRTTKLWGVYWFHSTCPSVRPRFRTRSVTPTVLDGLFPYLALMTSSINGCVAHDDLWPLPISSRSFRHEFGIQLLKNVTSCVRSTAHTVLDGFFLYLA